jgi:hypothetical protein
MGIITNQDTLSILVNSQVILFILMNLNPPSHFKINASWSLGAATLPVMWLLKLHAYQNQHLLVGEEAII